MKKYIGLLTFGICLVSLSLSGCTDSDAGQTRDVPFAVESSDSQAGIQNQQLQIITNDSQYSTLMRVLSDLLSFLPRLFFLPGDIPATVHDRENEHPIRFEAVHHPIPLHDDFPQGFILGLWDYPPTFRELPEPPGGKHQLLAEAPGIKRRVATDIAHEISQIIARQV